MGHLKATRQRPGRQGADAKPPVLAEGARPALLSDSRSRALLIVILFIAAFLRLYQLGSVPRGFYRDEAMNGSNALEIVETGHFQVFYPENNGREGLFINIATPFVRVFGNTAWAVRLPAAIFGILTVWGVCLLGAELFSPPIGLLAAFFTATSFWHVVFSRLALRANAAPFLFAWGLYLLLAGIRRLRQGKPYMGPMLLAGAVYGLGFHTYIAYRATPVLVLGMLLYFFFHARKQGWLGAFWRAAAGFGAAAALVICPLLIHFARNPGTFFGRTSQVSVFQAPRPAVELGRNIWKTAQMFFLAGDANWRHNVAVQREVFWPVAILFALGIATAIGAIRGNMRRRSDSAFPYAVALGWLVIAAVPVVLADNVPHALRSLLMVPPVFLLAAAGAHRAYGYFSQRAPAPRGLRIAAAAGFFLVLSYEPYHTYFDVWAPNPKVPAAFDAGLIDLAEQVNALPKEAPKYLAVATGGDLANGIPLSVEPVAYLTRSYTKKQREAANIHYVTPENFRPQPGNPAAGADFCEQVAASLPQAAVFCVK